MITYKRNFLDKVIVKIDFQPINSILSELNIDLSKKALELFPISEPKKELIGIKFQLSAKDVKREELGKKAEWRFHGKNREKLLCISSDAIYIEYKQYESSKILKRDFYEIIEVLFKTYRDIQVNRSGLRYINNIELDEKNLMEWEKYLNPNLLAIFNIPTERDKISRAFHMLEINYDIMNIRFQYGMHNPDFPAPIRKKIFLLDYDAFLQELQPENEIKEIIDKFHIKIGELFEICITDSLRELMNKNG